MKAESIEKMSRVKLIQESKRLQEAQLRLEEANARYLDLYDFAPVGYCTLDRDGYIREINLTGASLLETARDELIGKPFLSVPALNLEVFQSHMKRCTETNARAASNVSLVLKHGTQRILRFITDPVIKHDKPVVAYRTVLIDITEEKRFEDELLLLSDLGAVLVSALDYTKSLEAAGRVLVPALADLLTIDLLDEDGHVERVLVLFADSKKQERLADRMRQFSPRRGWTTVQAKVIHSGEPTMLQEMSEALHDRVAHDESHAALLRASGIESMMVVPLTVRGRTFGAMTFATAESGRRYSSPNLRLAETVSSRISTAIDNARLFAGRNKAISARDAILAVVSHDLRNSLNVIQLKTHVMLESPESQSRADAAFIQRRTAEMVRLIQDLLDVSSIEAGQLRLEKSLQAVEPLVKKALEAFEVQAENKSLKLSNVVRVQKDVRIHCDPDRIHQVLSNLISNAVKFTPAGGAVLVRAETAGGEVCLSVADTGPGIPDADLAHVFDRFWGTGKGGMKGTGLGLSITRGLVETHGGRIWAESQIGKGATFFFTLPIAPMESNRQVSTPAAKSGRR